jgi:hypothetical protein
MAPTATGLTGWLLAVVGSLALAFYAAKWYFTRHSIVLPESAAEWIKALGGSILLDAYNQAEKEALEPDAKRDLAATLIQAAATKYLGLAIPRDILNLLIEFIVNLVQHEGEAAVSAFVKDFPGDPAVTPMVTA